MKSKTSIVEGTHPPLYKSSIVSHVCFDNLSTDIYSYEIQDIKDFSLEIKKYSKYKKFKDNYNIIKIIGEGHFSKVYMVENNNKIYAAKIIDKDTVLEDNKSISMEIWEKNIFHYIKYVPNENIVKSIEYFENSENIYFIFEYLPDGILNSFDSNIIKEIYNGLLYLKRNGIIHRDIKAKNIMMNNGHPLIIDFGLSKIQSKNSLSYESYGTLTYIAPEIFENYGYNHKCDVWSFGIMLHCLKYGEAPFISEDDDKTKTVNKILEEKYEKKNDTIYDDLIEICLEKRNGNRKKISELIPWINLLS
jgi:serine/threonine protein kinase